VEFSKFWLSGPWRKLGRKQAERIWNQTVKTAQDLRDIERARDNYADDLAAHKWKAPQHGSTWFGNWRDYIDEEFEAREDDADMPLLDFLYKNKRKEDELRETAELVRKQLMHDREAWLKDKANHQHSFSCQFGKMCRFIGPTPEVPELEVILTKMKDDG